jgi:hypothetical protein
VRPGSQDAPEPSQHCLLPAFALAPLMLRPSAHSPLPPLRRQCLEVACRNANVKDGSGTIYERTGLCRTSASVKVKVVDT